jgi:sugar lactone lactonase YvrE
MKKFILIILILSISIFLILAKDLQSKEAESHQYKVNKKWETPKVLKTPESVRYDPGREVLYVSNIGGGSGEKDGNGFISKIKLSGEIEKMKWIQDLNAPKGSAIVKDKLYVADIDMLVEIDIETGKILNKYPVTGALFLNDVTADKEGNIYISDSSPRNSVIYRFSNGEISIWLKNDEVSSPNGLYAQDDKLIFGNSGDGSLKSASLSDKVVSIIANVGSGIDGLVTDGKGNYIVSDWRGKTSLITPSGQIIELINTTESKINSADIEYVKSKNLLIIPTFLDNRIMAYEVK